MRILFLDIDGVLNDLNFNTTYPKELFRPEAIQTLAEIIHQSGARIILSSTWKSIRNCTKEEYPDAYHQWQQLVNTLAQYGLEISDTTPDIKGNRPLEILEWLKIHKNENISSWISIEDDFHPEHYAKYGIESHLFQTYYFVPPNCTGGLKPNHISPILQMFKNQEEKEKNKKKYASRKDR